MWKVPAKAAAGVHALVAQPRQPGQQHVDLQLRALGRRLGVDRRGTGRASSWLRTVGATPDSTVAPARAAQALPLPPARQVTSPPGSTATTSAPVTSSAPGGDRGTGQPVGDGAHAADRHVPVAGPAADEVVEEADVLGQGRPVEVGERADERVRGHDAAHRVVAERRAQRLPQRPLDQRPPQLVVADQLPHGVGGPQRLQDGREDPLGQASTSARRSRCQASCSAPDPVSAAKAAAVASASSLSTSRPVPGSRRHRGVGGVAPAHQPHVELEVGHHLARQQRDEVAVARQPRVHARERLRRDRGPADVVGLLQHQDPAAGPGEVGRGGQPVVAGTHDDVVVRHVGRLCPASVPA